MEIVRLDKLLAAYRARRLPALAELIELAGKRAAASHELTGSLERQHETWLAVAREQRARDLEWLIANVITSRSELSIERICLLESWPDDPRMASGLLRLADSKRMTSRGSRTMWRIAFRIIGKRAHPGLAPVLVPLLQLAPQTEFEGVLLRRLRALEGKLERLVPPSPSNLERAALARLAQRLEVAEHRAAEKTAEDFLREIYAAPDDDGPREVFADWLQLRGDPRGELIALQLGRRRARQAHPLPREKALLAKHLREWVAPFEPVLSLSHCAFDRGFLYAATVNWRKLASLPVLMTHPAWATVRRFTLHSEGDRACDAWIEHMIALGAKRN